MIKKLIIGLGTGRCGTVSLSRFLTDQPGIRVLHEGQVDGSKSRPLRWEGDHENLLRWLDELATLCRPEPYYGDIGMYFLPYAEFLIERFDNIKLICLKRNRKTVIKSYLNWTEKYNHWHDHDGSVWEKKDRWDAAYPKFNEPDKAKALGLYWDMYHAEVDRLVAKYPRCIVCLPMDCLNHAAGQNQILDFIGYGGDRRISSNYVFNKGSYPIERFVTSCLRRMRKGYREIHQTLHKGSRQIKRFVTSHLRRMRNEGYRKIHQALILCMNLAMQAGRRVLPKAVRHFLWTRCAERIHDRLYDKKPINLQAPTMTTSPYPPVWVVNLPRSTERREYIAAHLQALGLPFEIVPAVDGWELPAQELAEVYSAEQTVACIKREMALGEVGCALSHLRLYQRMVDEDIKVALIIEDDAVLDPGLPDLLAKRQHWPADWEILMLYHGKGQISWWHSQAVTPRFRIGRFALPAYGTVGYLVTQSAARKILALAYPVRVPSDHWTGGYMAAAGLRIYGVDPCCVSHRHGQDALLHSTIPDKDLYRQLAGFGHPLTGVRLRLHRLKVWAIGVYHKYHPHKTI